MNALEYRALHEIAAGRCTWCRKETGHPTKIWCNGIRCLKEFILAERIVVLEDRPPKRKRQRNQDKPARWHYRYDIHDADAVEERGDASIRDLAIRLERNEAGLAIFAKRSKSIDRARSYYGPRNRRT